MARRIMREFKLFEVSAVDRPCQEPARMVIAKRDGGAVCKECGGDGSHLEKCSMFAKAWWPDFVNDENDNLLDPETIDYCKRTFTAEQRRHAAASGAAMPGGGFPIQNESDLHNAIRAIGRAKNPGAARAHIKERARALGLSNLIPDTWGKAMKKHIDFNKAVEDKLTVMLMKAATDNGANLDGVVAAGRALKASMESIADLDTDAERGEALAKTVDQAVVHLASLVPAGAADAFKAAVAAIPAISKGAVMDPKAELEKLQKRNAYLEALAKLSDVHKAFMDKMSDEDKALFVAKSETDRDAAIKASGKKKPPGKDDGDEPDDDDMKKSLAKRDARIETLEKSNAEFVREREEALCKALCRDNGLPESDHEMLAKLRKSDPEAAAAFLKRTKALLAQANPALFTELGKSGGGSDDPTADINAKALEMMNSVNKTAKSAAERMSIQKARMLVRENNPELAKAEREMENRRRHGRAA